MYLEFGFSLPVVLYGFYKLLTTKKTSGGDELLYLVYALETALTTLVCIHDVAYWDPEEYTVEVRRKMVFQFLGPWFLVREYSRPLLCLDSWELKDANERCSEHYGC